MSQKNIVLELGPASGNGRNSEGAFIELKDGRILFGYTKYITSANGDEAPSVIASRVSSDGGQTWSDDDRVLVEKGDAQNVMSVSFLRLASGRIALMYLQKNYIAGGLACTPFIRYSDDEMETLSAPVQLIRMQEYHCVNNDRLVQLKSGRLMVPVSQHRAGIQQFNNPGMIFFLYSDDEGKTWKESKSSFYRCFPDGHGWQEPGVIELEDGRLWAWMRTGWPGNERCGRQWETFSDDQGVTWTDPVESQFVSPYSPLSMKRNPENGDLLAVWNDHSGRFPTPSYDKVDHGGAVWGAHRTPLACAISSDEGQTWQHNTLLEGSADHGFCYTAIHYVGDSVLLGYCAGPIAGSMVLDHLRVLRIPLAELYAN